MSLSFLSEELESKRVIDYVISLTDFIAKFSWIYDFKLTRFLQDKAYDRLPDEWKDTLISLSVEELNELPFGLIQEKWPESFKHFISEATSLLTQSSDVRKCKKLEVESVCLSEKIKRGMKAKKVHEVERMVSFVGALCREKEIKHVVDVGSGLGYLGQALSSQFGLKVLGLESVETRCRAASRRQERLLSGSQTEIETTTVNFAVNDVDKNVSEFHDMLRRFSGIRGERGNPVCLLGLHCCGDLTPLMLKRFTECCPSKSVLVCIGCCYHRMSTTDKEQFRYFPMSAGVKSVVDDIKTKYPAWSLNVFALRLAAQETRTRWREQTAFDHDLHMKRVAFRAVLETALESEGNVRLHKVIKDEDCATFQSYITAALIHLDHSMCSEKHDTYEKACLASYQTFEPHFCLVEPFTALQVLIQPLLESLIITDRLIYLIENGNSSKMIAMFNDIISPRYIALVATKH
ncbi:probable methyltransferase-like protein 25 [Corticium candelabrum]|uniref:probable methyltransferase-like protein 25 n=1 Tax=Corticium candelabrum TaxID=121492 RepID=UPI002E26BBC0|nr:probable methyltransferase-like protein 25 [Corticium candelabrum]